MKTLITGASLLNRECDAFVPRDVIVENDRIGTIGAPGELNSGDVDQTIDAAGMWAIPGMINAHGHSYAGLLKGSIDAVPLDIYMLYAIAGGTARHDRAMYISAQLDALQMLKRGVTSFVDHYAQRPVQTVEGVEAGLRAYDDAGIRAVVAPMFADKPFDETVPFGPDERRTTAAPRPSAQSPQEYIEVVRALVHRWNGKHSRLHVSLGTDAPQRCSDDLLRRSVELEEETRCGWQTHLLEAKTQRVFAERVYGKGVIEHLVDDLDAINERMSFVHSVWLNDREIDLIARRNATIVHCLRSNLHLGSGVAPLGTYRDRGISVALGTDGGNLGSLDMLEVARFTALVHRVLEVDYEKWIDAASALRMVFHGGARVVDRNSRQGGGLGSLEEGCKADIVLLSPDNITWQPGQNQVRQLLYYSNESAVRDVMVDGKMVVRDGVAVTVDEKELLLEGKEIVRELGLGGPGAPAPGNEEISRYRKMYLENMDRESFHGRFFG